MSRIGALARKTRTLVGFATEFFNDLMIYLRHCGNSPLQDANRRRFYKLLNITHALEKGLSLREPRPLFGREKVAMIMEELDRYDTAFSTLPAQMAIGAFETYVAQHRARGVEDPLLEQVERYAAAKKVELGVASHGGLRRFPTAYDGESPIPADFVASRFSSRTFAPDLLPRELIEEVVALAQTTPSQCNRQSSHAHFFQTPGKIAALLALQGGSGGFTEDIKNLFVVSSDIAAWSGSPQRNQAYVDGALFAMSLLYALHANGLAACPLNLAVSNRKERKIKHAGAIPMDHRLIMMIAVGRPLSLTDVSAACSPRRATQEILRFGD